MSEESNPQVEVSTSRYDRADEGYTETVKGPPKKVTPAQVFAGHSANIATNWKKHPPLCSSAEVLEEQFHILALLIAQHCGDGGATTHSLNKLREAELWARHALPASNSEEDATFQ